MEFTFNGVIPEEINFNGNWLERVKCNGVTVWEKYDPVGTTLKLTSIGNSTVALQGPYDTDITYVPDIKYSLDGGNTWTEWHYEVDNVAQRHYDVLPLSDGEFVLIKGDNRHGWDQNHYTYFVMTGNITASGNIMGLLDNGACTSRTIPCKECFRLLFKDCSALTSIDGLLLPATTLADSCYHSMFTGCSSLTTVPQNLLPATTLTSGCYFYMFEMCTSLTTAPILPAETLLPSCYEGMFYRCSSLSNVVCKAIDVSAHLCTEKWLQLVSSTGTFVKNASMNDWTRDGNGIPSGWTVQNE